jgi:hypothetical protein
MHIVRQEGQAETRVDELWPVGCSRAADVMESSLNSVHHLMLSPPIYLSVSVVVVLASCRSLFLMLPIVANGQDSMSMFRGCAR